MSVNLVVSDEEIRAAADEADCMSDLLRRLGYKSCTGRTADAMRKRLIQLDIDKACFFSRRTRGRANAPALTLEQMLVENSTYKRYQQIKRKLIAAGLKENRCEICGLDGSWQDKPITLQVDHINGINNDNRLENLRLVCPNCHSQTATYGRANRAPLDVTCKCGNHKSANANVCWDCYRTQIKENK